MLRRVPNKVTRRVRESIYDVDDDSGGVHSQVRDQVCVLCTGVIKLLLYTDTNLMLYAAWNTCRIVWVSCS